MRSSPLVLAAQISRDPTVGPAGGPASPGARTGPAGAADEPAGFDDARYRESLEQYRRRGWALVSRHCPHPLDREQVTIKDNSHADFRAVRLTWKSKGVTP